MEKFNTVKKLLLAASVFASTLSVAQTAHPLKFNTVQGNTVKNWYKDYVGVRLQISAPSAYAKDLAYTTTNDGNTANTNNWGGVVTTPLVDIPIVMGTNADSFGCTAFAGGSMTGKIAVIWRGPLSSPCEFGAKAFNAQTAGAIACVIVNEYPGEGPVGMAAGAQGASVTIPVFMIGNVDGAALAGAYRSLPPSTVKMTITPWGRNNANDLGFVPGGVSTWHNAVIPAYQLQAAASTNPLAYKGINGAFVANYGTANQTNVKLSSVLKYTPTGSSTPATIETDTVTLASFPALDSIWAMFGPEYNLSGVTGTGKFDVTYNITSATTDQFPSDNTYTHTYYASDSVFSKSRYDFTNNHPIATLWTGPNATSYLWGVPYFVAKGGAAIKDIQFSASQGPGALPNQEFVLFYVFKWNDGAIANDKIIECGELSLVGTSGYVFGPTDSAFKYYNSTIVGKDTNGSGGYRVVLDDNTNYLICIEPNTTANLAIGLDGIMTEYPRSYGRKHFNNNSELYNPIFGGNKAGMLTVPADSFLSYTFGGGSYNVDSVVYESQYGLIPSLAMRVMPYNAANVKNTPTATKFELYPNPATDHVTVALELVKQAKNVSYTVINGMAQVVSRETKTDVLNDNYTYNTSKLPAGNYYIVVAADGKTMFKQFTVLKK